MSNCLFCRIVAGEIPATIVAQNAACIAFRDIHPQAPTHVLVIPRHHVVSVNELADASVAGALFAMAREIATSEGIAESGYRLVVNTGDNGGQTVHHLHLHLLGGRRLGWPPG
jgi:histidine triad (HIT) family protein